MGANEQEFRERISRIARIQKVLDAENEEQEKKNEKEPEKKKEYSPAICGVKKSLENFRHTVKEDNEEER